MDEAEQLSVLIGDIYDAALDQKLWSGVLEDTCGYIGGQSGAIMAQGPAHDWRLYFEWGTDPKFIESYWRTYGTINPMYVPTILNANPGSILASGDLIPREELTASRFYREWLLPQGIVDAITVTFEKTAMSYAMLTVQRGERHGLVDEAARRRMQLVAPHFRRAVTIGKIVDLHKFEAAAFADSLDGLADGMFLVDPSGKVMRANASGRRLLEEGAVLHANFSKLSALDAQADHALHEALAAAGGGDAAVGVKGIAVPLATRDGERYVAHVLPLTSGARRKAGTAYSAVAAVFVRKAALDLPHPLESLAQAYKLTPAELRVLMAIVQIGGIPEVAPVLGISETTVRTHLQHVFDKTGTSRQADLVKIVAGYMSPLSG